MCDKTAIKIVHDLKMCGYAIFDIWDMNIQNATLYYTHNKYFKLQIQRIKVLFMKVISSDSV